MKILFALAVLYLSMVGRVFSAEPVFEKLTLTEEFYSEGIAVADIDRDGHRDIVSGPFWYRGPDFRVRQRYASGDALSIQGYSKHFFTWTCDFNEDGHVDILTVGMPGEPAFWFQHPGTPLETEVFWNKHKVHDDISNESPAFVDIDGDDVPELVCIHGGAFGYIRHQRNGDEVSFNFIPVTPSLNYGRFTHGLGVGDVDGDGKMDLLANHLDQPLSLLENESESGNWVQFEFVGTVSEREAIGARIEIEAGEERWTAWQIAGDGYMCTNESIIHLGLGNQKMIDKLTVHWPSSKAQVFTDVAINQRSLLIEGQSQILER